jgi:hypothetical protein
MPAGIRERVEHVDLFQGEDPNFAGLHHYRDTARGYAYRDVAHYVWLYHQQNLTKSQRRPTVVIPWHPYDAPDLYLHELGHALHDLIGHKHVAEPVSQYATTDHYEAFAEALRCWLAPSWEPIRDRVDPATRHLFQELAVPL